MPSLIDKSDENRAKYEGEEIQQGLAALAFCSGNYRRAHRLLTELYEETGQRVPPGETIRQWGKTHKEAYQRIKQQYLPEVKSDLADHFTDLAVLAAKAQRKALERLDDEIDDVEAKDLGKIIQQLATAGGIDVDKFQLLRGEATQIHSRSLPEVLRSLEAKGVKVPQELIVDSTAEELPPADVPKTA